jgi:hypothetical protein
MEYRIAGFGRNAQCGFRDVRQRRLYPVLNRRELLILRAGLAVVAQPKRI